MTVLGGDDTGGIIWSPDVLRRARDTGLWLTKNNLMVDTRGGEPRPSDDELLPLMPDSEIEKLKRWNLAEMRQRVLPVNARDFHLATIDTAAHYRWEIAPVIGRGISQNRAHQPRFVEPQGFSVEWLRVRAGDRSAPFFTKEKMVLINLSNSLQVKLNVGAEAVTLTLGREDILSIPANVWRAFAATTSDAEAIIVLPGDQRKTPYFDNAILAEALAADVTIDAGGMLAKASLLPPAMLANVSVVSVPETVN